MTNCSCVARQRIDRAEEARCAVTATRNVMAHLVDLGFRRHDAGDGDTGPAWVGAEEGRVECTICSPTNASACFAVESCERWNMAKGWASSAGDRWGPDLRRSRRPLSTHPGPFARERIFVAQFDNAPSIPVVAAL